MITYIYLKDSTLWAFEGPEEPKWPKHYKENDDFAMAKAYYAAMYTARESALPVVNETSSIRAKVSDNGYLSFFDEEKGSTQIFSPDETIPLPGWRLEIGDQRLDNKEWRKVARLVRSEPVKP